VDKRKNLLSLLGSKPQYLASLTYSLVIQCNIKIKKMKWVYIKEGKNICRKTPGWNPEGTGSGGRPRSELRRKLSKEAKHKAKRLAENRAWW
jgi:hypothetical protein